MRMGTPDGRPRGRLRCYGCGETVVSHGSFVDPCPSIGGLLGDGRLRTGGGLLRLEYWRTPHPFDGLVEDG